MRDAATWTAAKILVVLVAAAAVSAPLPASAGGAAAPTGRIVAVEDDEDDVLPFDEEESPLISAVGGDEFGEGSGPVTADGIAVDDPDAGFVPEAGDDPSDADGVERTGHWLFGPPNRSYRPDETRTAQDKKKKWYEKYGIRGYAQFRYNRLGETNPELISVQGDRSIGDRQGFILRRARLILSGDVSDHVYIYIQPDFASGTTGPSPLHFLQIRDFYADIFLDQAKEFRFRVGQSKVPYGFENLQSSQNRIAFDRDDALNSAVANERDLGIFFYWAPDEIRQRFRHLVQSGLKGSGDYGVVGLGVYNGQTANNPERNNNLHSIFRVSYPFEFENGQFFEAGFGGYTGTFSVTRGAGVSPPDDFLDRRIALHWVWYPQPLGFQGEFNWGTGPQLNAAQNGVEERSLQGGYLQLFHRTVLQRGGSVIPYVRWQYYRGGRKHITNTPEQIIDETELGVEWEPLSELELTAAYTWANRTTNTSPYPDVYGSLIRLQLQWNY